MYEHLMGEMKYGFPKKKKVDTVYNGKRIFSTLKCHYIMITVLLLNISYEYEFKY